MSLVPDSQNIRLAMLGMVRGNGHPYSWTAIINGRYDRDAMAVCGYSAIPTYLDSQLPEALGIPGVEVTHVWCDMAADTAQVARATHIPHTVEKPEDVIGQVDAVIIATDIGSEHLERARPFIEAGLPVFIDKPLTDRAGHLSQFIDWVNQGRPILSGSALRYAPEFLGLKERWGEVGEPRLVTMTMCKTWERYGIHALEAIYPLLPCGGWKTISHRGDNRRNLMHLEHECGVDVLIHLIDDLFGAFGCLDVSGTRGRLSADFSDTFTAFKAQLVAMTQWLRTGEPPFAFHETVELIKLVIGGLRSRSESGRVVSLSEIDA